MEVEEAQVLGAPVEGLTQQTGPTTVTKRKRRNMFDVKPEGEKFILFHYLRY